MSNSGGSAVKRLVFEHRGSLPSTRGTLATRVLLALAPGPAAAASVFGSLANFDTVNDTGKPAYGFEIEIEDSLFFKSSAGRVFGLNRSFGGVAGGNPLGVVRFRGASVTDYNDALGHHAGVHTTYDGVIGAMATPTCQPHRPRSTCQSRLWRPTPSSPKTSRCGARCSGSRPRKQHGVTH